MPATNQKDYYQILGVDAKASPEQIKQAYRKLAFQYHPDRNKGNQAATEQMKQINEAYATLCDARKRQEYDALRERYGPLAYEHFRQAYRPEDIFQGSDINQIFEEFARTFGFRSSDDIFKEFYGPGYRRFEFQRGGVFGRGFIFHNQPSPADTQEPAVITDQSQAQPLFAGILGKMLKTLLQRTFGIQLPEKGKDWNDTLTLSPEEAQAGGEKRYHHRYWDKSKNLMVKVPPRIKNDQSIRLKGMGSPGKGGGAAGDLYLQVKIKRPLLARIKNLFPR